MTATTGCRNATPAPAEEQHQDDYVADTSSPKGVQRMNDYEFTDTVRHAGHTYIYTVERHASDSLPQVTDDDGVVFADNTYRLRIRRDGQPFVDRRFTKAAFENYLPDEMRRRGVLDGMMCDTSRAGLCFAVSVSLPQSDMYQPLVINIDAAGGIAIERDTQSAE